jgi:hypothetical protein
MLVTTDMEMPRIGFSYSRHLHFASSKVLI